MPTLQEITTAHSRRISELHQRRDAALRDAIAARDSELRALPQARALYQRFDKAVAEAVDDRAETEHKAAAVRDSALARAVATRGQSLTEAHAKRRAADLDALERKLQGEAAAEQKYRAALSALGPSTALDVRQKTSREAERTRQHELEDARQMYTAALTTAQRDYRNATEGALLDERAAERAAEQAYSAARRVAEASHAAVIAAAERELSRGLQDIVEARDALARYRKTVSEVRTEAAKDEQELFRRFRDELEAAS